jgi:hypothetical protein
MDYTPDTQNLQSTAVPLDTENEITKMIENHDSFGAVQKLHTAAHAMNDSQYHELLVHLENQNAGPTE